MLDPLLACFPAPAPSPVPPPASLSAPSSADDAYCTFLLLGEAYFTGGAEPRLDSRTYIEAWPRLLSFIRDHRDALLARGVVEAELQAGNRLCRELAECLVEISVTPPLPAVMARPTIDAAIARLERMRGMVQRLACGADGAQLALQFGIGVPLDPSQPAQVADAIARFLDGAHRNLERLHLFRFVSADLEELKAHRRALLSLCSAGGRDGEAPLPRADRLLAALEGLYASVATAISQAFPPDDPRRIAGLRCIPRARDRRGVLGFGHGPDQRHP
jgi:hypothetical protein